MASKRVASSSVNWQKLAGRLIPEHEAELTRLKSQNTTYSSVVNQLPADLPKIDFAALKKQLPAQVSILDGLQKQYESLSIPYGTISETLNAEISKWTKYQEARKKFFDIKVEDGAVEAKKVEEKWAKAPPVVQLSRQQIAEYFPSEQPDYRTTERLPRFFGLDGQNYPFKERFKGYKIVPRPNKVEDH